MRKKVFPLPLSPELYQWLKQKSESEERSMASYIRYILLKERKKDENRTDDRKA